MNIDSIKNGYVIDHIKPGKGLEIYEYLKLGDLDCQVAIIQKAKSEKMGRKDIIKIDQKLDIDMNVLGYIDSNITINVIEDDKRVAKFHPEIPEKLVNIVKCKNPRCITSVEQELDQVCILTDRVNGVYSCKYCESRVT